MRLIFLLLFVPGFAGTQAHAQNKNQCYSIVIENVSLCGSTYKWRQVKITAPRGKLLQFLRTSKVMHNCNYLLQSEEQISKKFTEASCVGENVKIEIAEPKDVIQLYKDAKLQDPGTSAEVCLNSDGTVSISFGAGDASFEVSSKGKFSFSAKGANGVEHKVEI